jgi:hypothetical protein
MLINIILQQIITPLEHYITEKVLYLLIPLLFVGVICWKNNWIDSNKFSLYVKKSYTIIGSEKDGIIDYCDTMNALTLCFIEDYKFNDIIVTKSTKHIIMLENVSQYKLDNDLYLSIIRSKEEVKYKLTSYNIDLLQFINNVNKKYDLTTNKKYIHMYGTETQSTYKYSQALTCVTYTLVHKYNLTNLINKNSSEENDDIGRKDDKKKVSRDDKIINEKKIKAIYLIDEYKNYKLEDDIYITIIRIGNLVKYSFYSESQNLIDFIDRCDNYYNTNINNIKYKYRLILQGSEISGERSKTKNIYPREIIAINYHLIYNCNYKNYRIIDNSVAKLDKYGNINNVSDTDKEEDDVNMFKYMIEDVGSIMFDEIILTIKRYVRCTVGNIQNVTVDYIFESDTVDLEKYITQCTTTYNEIAIENNKNKLYHFTLLSIDKGEPNFSSELIFDEVPLLHESFDNIFSEHNDLIIRDLARLKDIDYYFRTGLKRKKSYLQYGEPGCGKTASTIAAALHDKRHIIDIPMSLIKSCSDLEIIMTLKEINDISFTKDKIIIHFDEIDYGLNSLDKKVNDKVIDEETSDTVEKTIIEKLLKEKSDINIISLNLGALLSKFDGICNYNGLVIIATTNNKEKLDPALYREMRLTPLYYTFSRKEDIVGIIGKFFPANKKDIIIDFDIVITPAKLTFLCEKYEDYTLEQFIIMLKNI